MPVSSNSKQTDARTHVDEPVDRTLNLGPNLSKMYNSLNLLLMLSRNRPEDTFALFALSIDVLRCRRLTHAHTRKTGHKTKCQNRRSDRIQKIIVSFTALRLLPQPPAIRRQTQNVQRKLFNKHLNLARWARCHLVSGAHRSAKILARCEFCSLFGGFIHLKLYRFLCLYKCPN